MRSLKTLLFLALVILMMTGCGQQTAVSTATRDIKITVRVEPEPLAIGPAILIVTLTDANGSPVDGANLLIHADMDHEGMMPIDREVSESSSGEYRVPLEWTMGGSWIVSVTARLSDGSEVRQKFDFFVEAVSSESIINRQSGANAPEAAEIQVDYKAETEPLKVGSASVTIGLTYSDSSPVTDAKVEVTGNMSHSGMMPISGVGTHVSEGRYTVPLTWTMAGDWIVTVRITLADGRQLERIFNQSVVMP